MSNITILILVAGKSTRFKSKESKIFNDLAGMPIIDHIYYTAKNLSKEPSTGTASFNVSPPKAGSVFMKIECFCFINQKLMPNEEIKMPVSFYIDPEIDNEISH